MDWQLVVSTTIRKKKKKIAVCYEGHEMIRSTYSGIRAQAYLVLLYFIALCRCCIFYKLKVCGNLASSKSIGDIFPTAFAHFMSLCHILVILTIFQTFYYYYICFGDLWLVTFDVTIVKRLQFTEGSDDA